MAKLILSALLRLRREGVKPRSPSFLTSSIGLRHIQVSILCVYERLS
jgi:hypothetical protein